MGLDLARLLYFVTLLLHRKKEGKKSIQQQKLYILRRFISYDEKSLISSYAFNFFRDM